LTRGCGWHLTDFTVRFRGVFRRGNADIVQPYRLGSCARDSQVDLCTAAARRAVMPFRPQEIARFDSHAARGATSRHAVASKTEFPIALLARRDAVRHEGRRIQDYSSLLRRPARWRPRERCWHSSAVKLDDLPEWQWPDILAHLKCTKCGSVGWVDPRPNWGEVINYSTVFMRCSLPPAMSSI
jgi:hypothetical protein